MKTNARLFILLLGLFLLIPALALAVPACPDPVEITQPSGGPPIKVFLKGMEWNGMEQLGGNKRRLHHRPG
jgi:hypothetical protein